MGVMLFAFLALSRSLGESMQLGDTNQETAQATDAARELLEILDGVEDFSQVFFLYNLDPEDDPGGPGTAPGASFDVPELRPAAGDPDQRVGEIHFPTAVGASGRLELAEDADEPALGMPRDLDGDGLVDAEDHSTDYLLLPVTLRLRWTGANGERTLEVNTLLAGR
jgi:hypothetical protein